MKANKIQIGDFVFVNGTPRKVCAITKRKIGYHRDEFLDRTRLFYAVLQEVTPIHITEEILEKNGFTLVTDDFFRDDDNNVEVTFENEEQFPSIVISPKNDSLYMELTYPTCHSIYVHELQHALRLCGLNDLADNFKV